jgi:hypothetical protein
MSIRKTLTGLGAMLLVGGLIWVVGFSRSPAQSGPDLTKQSTLQKQKEPLNKALLAQAPRRQLQRNPNQPAADFVDGAIVIPNCHLNVDEKTEVSTQREGVLLFIGEEIKPGEEVPPDHIHTYFFGDQEHRYRKLKEGDIVKVNQVLGRIDDRLARDERNIKEKKLLAAIADYKTSVKTRDEAKQRYETQVTLYKSKATSQEELRGALLAWDKYKYEVDSKDAAIEVAKSELAQNKNVVELHEIRIKILGVVNAIYKLR